MQYQDSMEYRAVCTYMCTNHVYRSSYYLQVLEMRVKGPARGVAAFGQEGIDEA